MRRQSQAPISSSSASVGQCGIAAREIAAHLRPGAIVSDVGSVKAQVVRDMAPHLPANVHFVPAHPVAGTEYSGPDAGFAELFIDRWCILTPPENADAAAVARLSAFWSAGAKTPPCRRNTTTRSPSRATCRIAHTIVGTADDRRR
jgi:cyclohexadieny/prephenate dehydrogenase